MSSALLVPNFTYYDVTSEVAELFGVTFSDFWHHATFLMPDSRIKVDISQGHPSPLSPTIYVKVDLSHLGVENFGFAVPMYVAPSSKFETVENIARKIFAVISLHDK